MYKNKKFLLIAGGGTLGTYVSKELLRLGAYVEVVCPEDKVSNSDRLTFHQSMATEEFLSKLFSKSYYDGIVNFVHYPNYEDYKKIHPLLIKNTDHLIFLSSYRVYANEQHPITESAPRLLDVVRDQVFLDTENYAVPKARCEDYLRNERSGEPWTIVRPVISFSAKRFDLLMYTGDRIIKASEQNQTLIMPELVKNFTAGLDWAGNTGKLIANLLLKKETFGETYSVSSGQNLTWGQVADIYTKLTGVKIKWDTEDTFLDFNPILRDVLGYSWMWNFDRRCNRDIDCSKILKATGLTAKDFCSIEDGIKLELEIYNKSL